MKTNGLILIMALLLSACQSEQTTNQAASVQTPEVPNDKPVNAETNNTEVVEQTIDFTYQDLDNNEIKLSNYRGKWVVVNFWATWCPPCRKEMPDFVKFKANFADQVEIIGIDNEDADDDVIKAFVEDYEINYPIVRADVYNPTDFERENTMGLPTTLVFNPQGVQVSKRVGPIHYQELVEIVGFEDTTP